jgi:hypothetical protein
MLTVGMSIAILGFSKKRFQAPNPIIAANRISLQTST